MTVPPGGAAEAAASRQSTVGPAPLTAWLRVGWLVLAVVVAIALVFRDTVVSLADIWYRSETFTHGFLVAPASALVAWRLRGRLADLTPAPTPAALAFVAAASLLWTVAHVAGLLELEQVCFVGALVAAIVAVIGTRASRHLAFPLAFLFMMVPFGEILVPHLIEHTARFTVRALQVVGVPVVRDGDMLLVPGGRWRVVEACSGLRYLIASFTLGWFFAWWTFAGMRRRLIFVAFSIAVPIVANWMRATMIILLGYLSDNRLAVGVDHYLYGWLFFSIVMAILFGAGRAWANRVKEPGPDFGAPGAARASDAAPASGPTPRRRTAWVAAAVVAIAALGPAYASLLDAPGGPSVVVLSEPAPAGGWDAVPGGTPPWSPDVPDPDASSEEAYANGETLVWLSRCYFATQRQERELISATNVLVSTTNKKWRLASSTVRAATTPAGPLNVTESLLRSSEGDRLVWSWYWVEGRHTTDPIQAKWWGARARLLRERDAGALVAVSVRVGADGAEARRSIAAFVRDMLPSIDSSLRTAEHSPERGSSRS
jgi:exosortase A